MEMHRLRCGVIYSGDFARYLASKTEEEGENHDGEMLSLDYVRCRSGPRAGQAWWQVSWILAMKASSSDCFRIGNTEVFIHRQSQRGLRHRLLHWAGGGVVVRQ